MAAPHAIPPVGPEAPTPPIALAGDPAVATAHLANPVVELADALVERLAATGAGVTLEHGDRAEASRDWWPLAMTWALDNQVPTLAGAVVRPNSVDQIPAVLAACNEARVPVTAAAGRSGVCGSSVPLYGGVVLDLCGLTGIRDVDDTSLVVDVLPGTFGDRFEADLRAAHGLTVGHWPQSIALSTVGGWVACRGAGQLSNRYGKIEDMVVGLDVVLADGRTLTTGGNARQAVGPDLNQLFIGSEGTLGVITGVRLRAHPAPVAEERAAFRFSTVADAIDACRRILRRGGDPAVLRIYDGREAKRFGEEEPILLVLDEGDPVTVAANLRIVTEECAAADALDGSLVETWMGHRNDVAALEKAIRADVVVDTMEITGAWGALPGIYDDACAAIAAVEHTFAVSAHLSHSYTDGGCLYFTFAGSPPPGEKDAFYRAVWDAGTRAVLAGGGALSHHHGVGINRARFVREALGTGLDVLAALKDALDPNGILNPGKLGLPNPFGPNPFAEP